MKPQNIYLEKFLEEAGPSIFQMAEYAEVLKDYFRITQKAPDLRSAASLWNKYLKKNRLGDAFYYDGMIIAALWQSWLIFRGYVKDETIPGQIFLNSDPRFWHNPLNEYELDWVMNLKHPDPITENNLRFLAYLAIFCPTRQFTAALKVADFTVIDGRYSLFNHFIPDNIGDTMLTFLAKRHSLSGRKLNTINWLIQLPGNPPEYQRKTALEKALQSICNMASISRDRLFSLVTIQEYLQRGFTIREIYLEILQIFQPRCDMIAKQFHIPQLDDETI
jgi:hypothetical protein